MRKIRIRFIAHRCTEFANVDYDLSEFTSEKVNKRRYVTLIPGKDKDVKFYFKCSIGIDEGPKDYYV